jgi:hypothetical protein
MAMGRGGRDAVLLVWESTSPAPLYAVDLIGKMPPELLKR